MQIVTGKQTPLENQYYSFVLAIQFTYLFFFETKYKHNMEQHYDAVG